MEEIRFSEVFLWHVPSGYRICMHRWPLKGEIYVFLSKGDFSSLRGKYVQGCEFLIANLA